MQYGQSLQLPLAGTTSKEDVISRVEAYVQAQGGSAGLGDRWVEGMGWDQNRWPVKDFPTAVSSLRPTNVLSLHAGRSGKLAHTEGSAYRPGAD